MPLAPGSSSSYSLYEDSGVSVFYQRGVFTRTPIDATQAGDTLRVEIGPVKGSFPGMLKSRSYELRLPTDWPPALVTVDGKSVPRSQPGEPGWSFLGNTLTTIIPTPAFSTASKVTIEVRRAPGLAARRAELDGFAGAMTRLRGAYDALQQCWPAGAPPDALIDAMQTGDRLGYHPERAVEEVAHFHDKLLKAQAAVDAMAPTFAQRLDAYIARMGNSPLRPADMHAEKQRRLDSFTLAEKQVAEIGK